MTSPPCEPNHGRINHTFDVLTAAFTQNWQDWRGALRHLEGVYVIHDQMTGKSYVGSASSGRNIAEVGSSEAAGAAAASRTAATCMASPSSS